jgi:hypothetical protein
MGPLEITNRNMDPSENIIVGTEIRSIKYGFSGNNILLYIKIPVKYSSGNLISNIYFSRKPGEPILVGIRC